MIYIYTFSEEFLVLLQINHINRNSYYYFFLPNNILMLQNKEPNLMIYLLYVFWLLFLLVETREILISIR